MFVTPPNPVAGPSSRTTWQSMPHSHNDVIAAAEEMVRRGSFSLSPKAVRVNTEGDPRTAKNSQRPKKLLNDQEQVQPSGSQSQGKRALQQDHHEEEEPSRKRVKMNINYDDLGPNSQKHLPIVSDHENSSVDETEEGDQEVNTASDQDEEDFTHKKGKGKKKPKGKKKNKKSTNSDSEEESDGQTGKKPKGKKKQKGKKKKKSSHSDSEGDSDGEWNAEYDGLSKKQRQEKKFAMLAEKSLQEKLKKDKNRYNVLRKMDMTKVPAGERRQLEMELKKLEFIHVTLNENDPETLNGNYF